MKRIFSTQPLKIAFISTYSPQQCGIATFTADLLNYVKKLYIEKKYIDPENHPRVIALNNKNYEYNNDVCFTIKTKDINEYRQAADFINHSSLDIVSLQHEFGIFSGFDGRNILYLLEALKKPIVTTLHTVLKEPTPGQLKTMKKVCEYSTKIVVLAQKAASLLQDVYNVPREKIVMIHHGTPNLPFLDPAYYKEEFQAEGKKIMLTFGLLGPNKGIEYVLQALPKVVEKFPDLIYFILGATHPGVIERFGEKYRQSLEKIVLDNNLQKNVIFFNQYVSMERLLEFVKAADIYINPYVNKEQISSGTLAYAVASGKAIISTPYWYAEELLANERGTLVPFRNSSAIADALIKLLSDEILRDRKRKSAYEFGRQMIWEEVAKDYVQTFEQALLNYRHNDNYLVSKKNKDKNLALPEINLQHLRTLTDDTGLFQHAVFSIPNRTYGYCTDDNARALIMATANWNLFKNNKIIPLLDTYLSFLNYAFNEENQQMRNFMSYNREWLEESGSEDSQGRAIWALGYTCAFAPDDTILCLAARLFKRTIANSLSFTSPRAWAFTIIGSLYYLEYFSGDTKIQTIVKTLSKKLLKQFQMNSSKDWFWCEDIITYDNARLPQALITAGHYLKNKNMTSIGLNTLQWLINIQTDPQEGHLSIIGNKGWYPRGGKKATFDQQPLEAAGLVDACYQAFLVSKKVAWKNYMHWAFAWFLGKNNLYHAIYNPATGGCHDGIRPGGINQNQGGESTISYLLALHQMHQVNSKPLLSKKHSQNNVS
ncbi:MAG: glycosyltransferase family 4 protein [Clostridia bacterium]|nr:glycosyltransferase family 4 protein [Clostridia bacterium]